MLLASYQPIYTETERKRGYDKRSQYAALDFEPVWCISAANITDLYVSSLMAAPRFPDMFTIISTDSFLRVDKVGWYQYIRDGKAFSKDLVVHDLPDTHSEFIVPKDIFESGEAISFPVISLPMALEEKRIRFFMKNKQVVIPPDGPECQNLLGALHRQWKELENADVVFPDGFVGNQKYKGMIFKCKWIFECCLLPVLYTIAEKIVSNEFDGKIVVPVGLEYSCSLLRQKAYDTYARFFKWQDGNCSRGEFDAIVNALKKCVVTDPDFLYAVWRKGGGSLNGPCPCGSGKKFKRCHGKV